IILQIWMNSVDIGTMADITKNQISLALIVIVFTTTMIASNVESSTDNLVFASRGHHHHDHFNHHSDQDIGQSTHQHQHSFCLSAGAGSPVTASCNNAAGSANFNTGNNGLASDHGGNGRSNQDIGQSTHQHQHSFCLSAGAGSPVTASCNNAAGSANFNTGNNGLATTHR